MTLGPKVLTPVDMTNNPLLNVLLEVVAGNPSSPVDSRIWTDSTNQTVKVQIPTKGTTDLLARSTHTGTQTASTISDFITVVQAVALNTLGTPVADWSNGSHKITNVADPTNAQDVGTKNYIDAALATATSGLSYKAPVLCATIANDTLSGLAARDGITPTAGKRVLVKNQTTGSANGIYLAAAGAWTRTTDADSPSELVGGVIVPVDQGTTNADTAWMLASDVTTVGTTSQSWIPFGQGTSYTAGNGVAIASNVISAVIQASQGLLLAAGGLAVDFTSVVKKFVGTITGDGTTKTFPVTHNLNNLAPVSSLYSGTQQYGVDFQPASANGGSFVTNTALPTGTYNFTLMG